MAINWSTDLPAPDHQDARDLAELEEHIERIVQTDEGVAALYKPVIHDESLSWFAMQRAMKIAVRGLIDDGKVLRVGGMGITELDLRDVARMGAVISEAFLYGWMFAHRPGAHEKDAERQAEAGKWAEGKLVEIIDRRVATYREQGLDDVGIIKAMLAEGAPVEVVEHVIAYLEMRPAEKKQ